MFTLSEFLREEVKPALGCTEPGAVALATAKAVEQLGDPPAGEGRADRLDVIVSNSIYKNGIAVGIPGTGGLRGNEIAAALAVSCGKSEYGLEVLKDAGPEDLARARRFMEEGKLTLAANGEPGVYVEATAHRDGHTGVAVIRGSHSNIVEVRKDGEIVFQSMGGSPSASAGPSIAEQVAQTGFETLVALVDDMSPEDVDYIWEGVTMNERISQHGFEHGGGLELGRTVRESSGEGYERDLAAKIKAISAAASDARMSGASMPVMSSAGSGNHGITAILPVRVVGDHYGKGREEIARAIAYSHLATSYIKSRMGRLSPVCGCAVAAGAGAAAGIVKLLGGDDRQAQTAMELVVGNIVGMVCDGAKETCSLKVGTGATEAFYAARMALAGRGADGAQGVVDPSDLARTVDNATRLNSEGMKDVDRTLIDIMSSR